MSLAADFFSFSTAASEALSRSREMSRSQARISLAKSLVSSCSSWGLDSGNFTLVMSTVSALQMPVVRLMSKRLLNQILARHSGQPVERVEKDTDRDNWMTAQEAKEYGLVDNILERMTPRS